MVEQAGALPGEAETTLSDSRAQFVASLGRRLEALREALSALQQAPRSPPHRDHLRRRIHAFGAAAGVLGFDRVFEAFREAESVLGRSGPATLGAPEIALIARTLDLVPSLVLGSATPAPRTLGGSSDRRGGTYPTSVLVFGAAPLAESLNAAAAAGTLVLECERTEDAEHAEEFVRVTAPDVAVIDADRHGARELIETLTFDPLLDPVRIIAVGTFDRPEAAASLVALGVARVLPKPVSPDALKRSVLEVSRERTIPIQRVEPLGDATIETLAERLAQEMRRGLVEAVRPEGRGETIALGEGTDVLAAIWGSVARIRELVTLRSGGTVRFEATGPEGAVPLTPWMSGEDRPRAAKGSERRSSDGVSLKGRTIVVVDDDPSVVWFLSGLLRATGAEVLEAHDGTRALALVRERWPDLVVSDILMPGLDGFALCREIKRDVALADVPVILLSWKEDMLQRARELGADADGYLRKEASASVVVQRAREVLLPRARVEARVTAGGEVRGRLDGLTPRLILEIACRYGRNTHVTIRDAAFLYEVNVRDGQVRSASRTASDGRAESGERALSALLGVRAGRFAVRPDETEVSSEWSRDLRELVRGPVERARGAQSLLGKIERVARIEVDTAALEPYLAVSPQSARTIVQRLVDGEAPASILASGVPVHVFESVLVDAILHGAVTRVTGSMGEDLAVSKRGSGSVPIVPAPVAIVTPAPPAAVPAVPSAPAPASVVAAFAAPDAAAPATLAVVAASEEEEVAPPSPVAVAAEKVPTAAEEFASFFLDSIAPPAPTSDERDSPRPLPLKAPAPPTSAPAEPSPLETALLSLPAPAARPRSGEWKAAPAAPPSPKPEPSTSPPRPSPPRPEAHAPAAASGESDLPAPSALPPTVKERVSGRAPPDPLAATALLSEKRGETPVDLGAAVLSALGSEEPARVVARGEEPPPPTRPDRPTTRGAEAIPVNESTRKTEPPKSESRKASGAPRREHSAAKKDAGPPPSAATPGNAGTFGIMVVACVAAVSTYLLVTAYRSGTGAPEPRLDPSANLVPPSPVAATALVRTLAPPVDLELPAGVTVEPGKGLLEVLAPPSADVVVDGVLVGKGPLRQLPLRPGPHEVRISGPGVDAVRTIEVLGGRRARLVTASAP